MIVAGFHPVAAALAERPEAVEALLLQEGRRDARARELERTAREKGIPVRHVPREELDRTAGKAHNGVAARVATREYDPVEEALGGEPGSRLVLFLDEVTDPGNLGSILRTAAAAGASVVLPERHSAGLNESVSKASAGALERVKVARVGNAARFLEDVKKDRFWVWGASPEGEPLWDVDLTGDVVLCLGAEGPGLRRLTRETCDRLVAIPMAPGAGSMNVAVSAAVLLFEALRQRRGDPHAAGRSGADGSAPSGNPSKSLI